MLKSMKQNSEWSEKRENGITLGPEEALLREIEKNKGLKVEKLRLQNKISKLRSENSNLANKNQLLNHRLKQLSHLPHNHIKQNLTFKDNLKRFTRLFIWITAILTSILFIFIIFKFTFHL